MTDLLGVPASRRPGIPASRIKGRPFVLHVHSSGHRGFFRHVEQSVAGTQQVHTRVALVDAHKKMLDVVLVGMAAPGDGNGGSCLTAVLDETAVREYRNLLEDQTERLNNVIGALRRANQAMIYAESVPDLADEVCRSLVDGQGYVRAWIVLVDSDGEPTGMYAHEAEAPAGQSGITGKDSAMPSCLPRILATDDIGELDASPEVCRECPVGPENGNSHCIARVLRYRGELYGALLVSLAGTGLDTAAERGLFVQLSNDLGFSIRALVESCDGTLQLHNGETGAVIRASFSGSEAT